LELPHSPECAHPRAQKYLEQVQGKGQTKAAELPALAAPEDGRTPEHPIEEGFLVL